MTENGHIFMILNTSAQLGTNDEIYSQLYISPLAVAGVIMNLSLFTLNTFGNLLTIVTVYRTPSLQTVPNMYIVSLAVADLLTGFAILYYMLSLIPYFNRIFNTIKYLCLLRYTLTYTYVTQSFFSMCLISIDRLLYIKYAFYYHAIGTVRNAGIAIAISWIVSVIIGTVPLYDYKFSLETGCSSNITKGYQLYGTAGVFLVCLFCTLYCYAQITRIALRQRRAINAALMLTTTVDKRSHQIVDGGYLKSVKLFAIVFFVFVILWSPISILCIVLQVTDFYIPSWSVYLAITLGFINSCINVLIYAWRSENFRHALRDTLRCRKQ